MSLPTTANVPHILHQQKRCYASRAPGAEGATDKNSKAGRKCVPSHACNAPYALPTFPTRAFVQARPDVTPSAPDAHSLSASVPCRLNVLFSHSVIPDVHTSSLPSPRLPSASTSLLSTFLLPIAFMSWLL